MTKSKKGSKRRAKLAARAAKEARRQSRIDESVLKQIEENKRRYVEAQKDLLDYVDSKISGEDDKTGEPDA